MRISANGIKHCRPDEVEMTGLPNPKTVPSALVDAIAKCNSILSPSIRLAVAEQTMPPKTLNCCGVPSVNSITPKSLLPAGKCDGCFEQPMINAAIKAAVVMRCMFIKCETMPNDQKLSHAAGDSRQPETRSENCQA